MNWLLQKATTNPHTVSVYAAPRMDQVSRFSRDRLRRAIKDSPVLRTLVEKARPEEGKEAISRVPFSNGSLIYLVSAWGEFDALRNIPADFAGVDEIQDLQSEALPVIEEAMSHSKFNEMMLVGTASDEGSDFCKKWLQSDQKEWDPQAQAWIPKHPELKTYSGYHMSQEMASWIITLPPDDPNSLQAKRARYSDRRYINEVLGLFYRGRRKPLLAEDIQACLDRELILMERLDPPYNSYMGVDWGGGVFSYTVAWIMALDELDRWRLLYVRKFEQGDPMKEVETISNLINQFNVKQVVADIGYGAVQVSELQKRYASRVLGCQYTQRPEIPLELRHKDEFGERLVQMTLMADRSFWMQSGIDLIMKTDVAGKKTPMLVIPYGEPLDVEWFFDHFTVLEMEEHESRSGKRVPVFTHPEGEPDDAYHAYIYALIARAATRMQGELRITPLFP